MPQRPNQPFEVFVPLTLFEWNGNQFSIPGICSIARLRSMPDLSHFHSRLSEYEMDELLGVSRILMRHIPPDRLSPGEKTCLVLLALWLATPTKLLAGFRFELGPEGRSGFARILDRFLWLPAHAKNRIHTQHLVKARRYVTSLRRLRSKRGPAFGQLDPNVEWAH